MRFGRSKFARLSALNTSHLISSCRPRQADDVAGIQWHPQDRLVRYDVADLGARHLKQLGVTEDRRRLVESSELEQEIQLQSIAQRGDDVGASRAREAGELGGHGVRPQGALGVVHEAGYLGRVGLRAGAARLEHQDERGKGHAEKLS